jgi:hypothetical protein
MDIKVAKAALRAAKAAHLAASERRIEAQKAQEAAEQVAKEAARAAEALRKPEDEAERQAETMAAVVRVLGWEESERADFLGEAYRSDLAPDWALRRRVAVRQGRWSGRGNRWLPELSLIHI